MLFTVLIYHQHIIVAPIFFHYLTGSCQIDYYYCNYRFSRIVKTRLLNDDNTGSYYYFISEIIIPCQVYMVVYFLIAYPNFINAAHAWYKYMCVGLLSQHTFGVYIFFKSLFVIIFFSDAVDIGGLVLLFSLLSILCVLYLVILVNPQPTPRAARWFVLF